MLRLLICLLLVAPQVSALDLKTQLQKHKGKVVLLDFWASWCGPCKESFPWMNDLYNKYNKQGLEILAVNLDEDKPLAETFLKENPAQFKILYDPSGKTAENHQVQAMPSSFLYDRSGKVAHKHIGFSSSKKQQYENEIQELLKKKK